jgi:hypothetical protein
VGEAFCAFAVQRTSTGFNPSSHGTV